MTVPFFDTHLTFLSLFVIMISPVCLTTMSLMPTPSDTVTDLIIVPPWSWRWMVLCSLSDIHVVLLSAVEMDVTGILLSNCLSFWTFNLRITNWFVSKCTCWSVSLHDCSFHRNLLMLQVMTLVIFCILHASLSTPRQLLHSSSSFKLPSHSSQFNTV